MTAAYFQLTATTDASGDATVDEWNGDFEGKLAGWRIDYDSAPSGADVTLSEPRGLARTIDTVTNNNTDTTRNPQWAIQGATDAFTQFSVDSNNLQVVVAQGGDTVTYTVIVLIEGH